MKSLNFLTHQEIFDSSVQHLFGQGQADLLPHDGGAYRGYCGGCPTGRFIKPRDYLTAMEGVPIRYISKAPEMVPAYMDVGVAVLKRALLRAHQCFRSQYRRTAFVPAERARRLRQMGMERALFVDRASVRPVGRAS